MTCRWINVDGVTAIVCGPKPRRKRCSCGKPGEYLCDWKIGGGKTCDKPICDEHAEEVAEDKHLCPEHQEAYRAWLDARRK